MDDSGSLGNFDELGTYLFSSISALGCVKQLIIDKSSANAVMVIRIFVELKVKVRRHKAASVRIDKKRLCIIQSKFEKQEWSFL